jgi:hypothetical protein
MNSSSSNFSLNDNEYNSLEPENMVLKIKSLSEVVIEKEFQLDDLKFKNLKLINESWDKHCLINDLVLKLEFLRNDLEQVTKKSLEKDSLVDDLLRKEIKLKVELEKLKLEATCKFLQIYFCFFILVL